MSTQMTLPLPESTTSHTRVSGGSLRLMRLAWGIGALLALILDGAALVYNMKPPELAEEDIALILRSGLPLNFVVGYITLLPAFIVFCFLAAGILLFVRRSNDWFTAYVSMAIIMGGGAFGFTLPLAQTHVIWQWLFMIMFVLASVGIFSVLLLFPNGEIVPRWAGWAIALNLGFMMVRAWVLFHAQSIDIYLFVINLIMLVLGVIAQIYRYRRISTALQRQQSKWIIYAFILTITIQLLFFLVYSPLAPLDTAPPIIAALHLLIIAPLVLITWALPVIALLISILRYRLWDIDFLINRSLVYGLLTLLLVGVFVGGFALSRAILEAILGSSQVVLAAVIPAAAAAGMFAPSRTWLRRLVDERLYGIKIDYKRAKEAERLEANLQAAPADTSKQTQFGSYSGLTLIGRGGMGEVYRGQHLSLDRRVAIKTLLPYPAAGDETHRRFAREAQTIAKLKHPNIITLYEVGEQDGIPYMVMEYIEGTDLGDLLRHKNRFTLQEALPIFRDVGSALDYAHGQGVIHRDIKPSNIMIETAADSGSSGVQRTVLMDFGIAKSFISATKITQSGMIGTLDYISPEQIQAARDVDARADVYSFGVMAYQVLTGTLPFRYHNIAATVLAHLNQPPPDARHIMPTIPYHAAAAIMQAMAKKPEERFTTAGEFITALSSEH